MEKIEHKSILNQKRSWCMLTFYNLGPDQISWELMPELILLYKMMCHSYKGPYFYCSLAPISTILISRTLTKLTQTHSTHLTWASQFLNNKFMEVKMGGSKKKLSSRNLGRFLKEQRGRFYIVKTCVVMLLCWQDWWCFCVHTLMIIKLQKKMMRIEKKSQEIKRQCSFYSL